MRSTLSPAHWAALSRRCTCIAWGMYRVCKAVFPWGNTDGNRSIGNGSPFAAPHLPRVFPGKHRSAGNTLRPSFARSQARSTFLAMSLRHPVLPQSDALPHPVSPGKRNEVQYRAAKHLPSSGRHHPTRSASRLASALKVARFTCPAPGMQLQSPLCGGTLLQRVSPGKRSGAEYRRKAKQSPRMCRPHP